MNPAARIYNLFPLLAGTSLQWAEHLPAIQQMGFDWVYLNPFHYPGFSGSLYAIKSFDRLHPALDSGDGLDAFQQLRRFCDAAAEKGIKVMVDLVINHASKDSLLAQQRPDFFVRDERGQLVSPFAIDPADARKVTVWGDLASLDYSQRPAYDELLQTWLRLIDRYLGAGVQGFRCDAAYQVPCEVWSTLIYHAKAQRDVLFVAETLGARLEQVHQLAGVGFDAFFNSSKWWNFSDRWLLEQYEAFRQIAPSIGFAESHDTTRLVQDLQDQGIVDLWQIEAHYRLRYLFSVFFSTGVMMPIGFESGQRRKLDVVKTRSTDWDPELFDLRAFIAAANRTKQQIRALNEEGPMGRITSVDCPVVGLLRTSHDGLERCLALIHPSSHVSTEMSVDELQKTVGAGWQTVCDTNIGAVEGNWMPGETLRFHPISMRILVSGPDSIAR